MSGFRQRVVATVVAVALAAVAGCNHVGTRDELPTLTVLLLEYEGPQAGESADRLAGELKAQGLEDVFTVKGHEYASVCVGRFGSWKDPAADRTLRRVRRIRDAQGQYPFASVMLMPVPEPAPENPWPLEEADGQYTLIVASWAKPGRKSRAQAYGRRLRQEGHEAYVYHGPTKSTVSVGAFGPEIFDDPTKVGQPDAHPNVVDPRVKRLRQAFPTLVLEGEPAPAEAKLKPYLGIIPGRHMTPVGGPAVPDALYRVTILLVDTRTGLAEGRRRASGVAQGRVQLPTLLGALVRQLMTAMEPERPVQLGVAGVATDEESAPLKDVIHQALHAALRAAGAGKIRLYSHQGTVQVFRAYDLTVAQVLQDPHAVEGLQTLDYVAVVRVRRQG